MTVSPANIPELRLSVLDMLVERFTAPPNLFFIGKFGEGKDAPSDTIEWESRVGTRLMAPFMAPGSKTPLASVTGTLPHSARAAFWGRRFSSLRNF